MISSPFEIENHGCFLQYNGPKHIIFDNSTRKYFPYKIDQFISDKILEEPFCDFKPIHKFIILMKIAKSNITQNI